MILAKKFFTEAKGVNGFQFGNASDNWFWIEFILSVLIGEYFKLWKILADF